MSVTRKVQIRQTIVSAAIIKAIYEHLSTHHLLGT